MGIGLIRVLLALTVVITHTHPIFGFTLGNPVIAVRSFFIISGFYMAMILNEKYSNYSAFITNRILRIYPIYWIILLLTVLNGLASYFYNSQWGELDYFIKNIALLNPVSIIFLAVSHLAIFGRNAIMFMGIGQSGFLNFNLSGSYTTEAWPLLLVPQAWTLGLEMLFYLIAPFIVKRKTVLIALFLLLTISLKQLLIKEQLNDTMWTYRFFPTELTYFIFGVLSYKIYTQITVTRTTKLLGLLATLFVVFAISIFNYLPRYLSISIFTEEWIYYIILALLLPFIFIYSKNLKFDRRFGEFSYPIYISHVLVNNSTNTLFFDRFIHNRNFQALSVFLLSLLLSVLILKFIQDPIDRIRQQDSLTYLRSLKSKLLKNRLIKFSYFSLLNLISRNKKTIKGKNNHLVHKEAYLERCSFFIAGNNNVIVINPETRVANTSFFIQGNNNKITIGSSCQIKGGSLWIEDNNCQISIGAMTTIESAHLACTEDNSAITIGDDCMLASDIDVRTGDSHSVIDKKSGKRLNKAESVVIGNHVWIAAHVNILKGARIADDSIIATGSIVTKEVAKSSIFGGVPAKLIKTGVSWRRERL